MICFSGSCMAWARGRPMPAARLEHWLAENRVPVKGATTPTVVAVHTADGTEHGYAAGVTPLRPSIRRRANKGLLR